MLRCVERYFHKQYLPILRSICSVPTNNDDGIEYGKYYLTGKVGSGITTTV